MNPQQITAPVITVDGASGTGKGTISQLLANHLGWHFLDSGALYRVLGLAARKHQIALHDETALLSLLHHLDVKFITKSTDFPRIFLEEEEVTFSIRTEEIGKAASIVGTIPAIRTALLDRQRAFCKPPGLVADGRDMGTVVFKDAALKIFLYASLTERANRRYKQLKEGGINVTLDALIEELRERDRRDQQRTVAPLKPAEDAICIDTDPLSIRDVVERILGEIQLKKAFPAIFIPLNDSLSMNVAE